ncbi:MAG: hypothetical protein RLZZ490_2000 [Cyanobacteriota bacterium]|jgi:hypothetical protein
MCVCVDALQLVAAGQKTVEISMAGTGSNRTAWAFLLQQLVFD